MPAPIHVCILTTAHATDDMRVYYKMAHAFASSGMRVSWVGPDISLYGNTPDDPEIPLSRHLYSRLPGRSRRLMRFRSAYRTVREIENVDVFYCPDPDSAFVGWWLARRSGGKVIFDLHEHFQVPHTVQRRGRGLRTRFFGRLVQLGISILCRRVDLVVGVSDSVLSPFRGTIREALVVRNCAPKRLFSVSSRSRKPGEKPFTLMHGTGALGRGTDVVLEAVAAAKHRVRGLRVIVFNAFTEHADGYGEQAFRKHVDRLGIAEQIDFREPIPMRSIPGVLQTCDAGLIGYGRRLGVGSLPNRLFEYMASGLAVIAPSYAVEIKDIIEKEQCGLLVDFEDPEAVAEAIAFLNENPDQCQTMGDRARRAFEDRHNWELEVQPLLERVHQGHGNGVQHVPKPSNPS
ncbi:MAG TPA: glycosyltransferase family 4 protein [Anaerolineae bacterium]|nr:glycosyltransferase family 4 protein [Anaerolineae bacterium]